VRHCRVPLSRVSGSVSTLVVLAILVVWPLAVVFGDGLTGPGLDTPGQTLSARRAYPALNTTALAALVLAIALPVGASVALLVSRCDLPGRYCAGVLAALPLWLPIDLHAAAWLAAFAPHGLFGSLALSEPVPRVIVAAWIHAMAGVGWVVFGVGIALHAVEPELEEDGLLLMSACRTVWYVTLRRATAGIVAAALLVVVLAATEMAVTDLLQVRSYAERTYVEFVQVGRAGAAARSGLPLFAVLGLAVAWAGRLVVRAVPDDPQVWWANRPTFPLGCWRWPAALYVGLVLTCTLGVPVASLVRRAGIEFSADRPRADQPAGSAPAALDSAWPIIPRWSPAAFWTNLRRGLWTAREELVFSSLLACGAAGISVVLGGRLAWWARESGLGRSVAWGVTVLLLAAPAPVLGMGVERALLGLRDRCATAIATQWLADAAHACYDSPLVLLWVQVLRSLPYVMLVLGWAVRFVPRAQLEAAALDGASPARVFWHIAFPALRGPMAVSALIAAVLSLGELGASVIVAPPGTAPLGVRIFTLAHNGVDNALAAICLWLLVLVGVFLVALACGVRWFARRSNGRVR
jgi:ABC-type Fe3+ transport system permease subunit